LSALHSAVDKPASNLPTAHRISRKKSPAAKIRDAAVTKPVNSQVSGSNELSDLVWSGSEGDVSCGDTDTETQPQKASAESMKCRHAAKTPSSHIHSSGISSLELSAPQRDTLVKHEVMETKPFDNRAVGRLSDSSDDDGR